MSSESSEAVSFTDKSIGGAPPLSYEWDLNGDGIPDSTVQNPSYAYDSPGVYTIVLKIADSAGNTDSEIKTGYIIINAPPIEARFEVERTKVIIGQEIRFTDKSAGGVPPLHCEWDLDGDGTIDSMEQNPSFAYSAEGTYTVALRVTDARGETDFEIKENYISVYAPPKADFVADKTEVWIEEPVYFTDLSSGGVPSLTYEWDFDGDGETDSISRNPGFAYSLPGVYTVTLKIRDAAGNEDAEEKADYIIVSGPPFADFSADRIEIFSGEEVHFTDKTIGGVGALSYEWDFDDDGVIDSFEQNPVWSYEKPGTYTVVLKVTDEKGNTDVEIKENYIRAVPHGDVDRDGRVNVADLSSVAAAFGSTPTSSNWNPKADLNQDDLVDIFDLVEVGRNIEKF